MTVLSARRPQRVFNDNPHEETETMAIENSTSPAQSGHVVIGVDTHKHVHVAAVLDPIGGVLATLTIPTDAGGFRHLLNWATSFGHIIAFGHRRHRILWCSTGLIRPPPRVLSIEVNRPDRRMRRRVGKSDTLDAENAARAVLAGFATAIPKTADGTAEMIRQLKVVRDTVVKNRAATMVTLKAMSLHVPEPLRKELARRPRSCSPGTWQRCARAS
ncbi:hypothetical protein DXK94_07985 [Arthrobacter sp. RT-1]|nr:hypothetical protein DXK94_07985 [Arthrobacter sp. RT-1]